jgi:PDZ domain-containing protein
MRRHATTLVASAVVAVGLFFAGMSLPVPYVQLTPGPVTDTLGTLKGEPLIDIKGHQTAQSKGKIYLVTVLQYGGPGEDLPAFKVLSSWWDNHDAIVPRRVLYPPTVTAEEVQQQDAADMDMSQEDAKVAALRYLGYDLQPGVDVADISDTSTAKGKLQEHDIIVGVDDAKVANSDALLAITKQHKVGDSITLHVNRNGQVLDVPVTLQPPRAGGSAPSIGISVVDGYTKPFEIDIRLNDVGGPSAGLAFTLGIIDKLTDGNLTGGLPIASTGTIDTDGKVGAIGGVQQKEAAVKDAGAVAFLVPDGNCAEALKEKPKGLKLVKVSTLAGAVDAIKTLRSGGTPPLCAAG